MAENDKSLIKREFRELIESGMRAQGLSGRQLALRAGISVSFLWRILAGERNLPSDEAILRLEQVLRIRRGHLLVAAGRIPFRAARDLTNEELDAVMHEIRRLMVNHRRPKKVRRV